jgi:hypothetical protein
MATKHVLGNIYFLIFIEELNKKNPWLLQMEKVLMFECLKNDNLGIIVGSNIF